MDLQKEIPRIWRDFLGEETLRLLPQASDLGRFQPRTLFRALEYIEPGDVRVVFLGMDPYPGEGVPEGLAFSVPLDQPIPQSLRNIFLELEDDMGIRASSGSLVSWAKDGVLLWNVALTVRAGQAGSHLPLWRPFSVRALSFFSDRPFILLGRHAQDVGKEIGVRYQVEAPHPSPLSAWRGFLGSRIFSRTNALLLEQGSEPLSWKLD